MGISGDCLVETVKRTTVTCELVIVTEFGASFWSTRVKIALPAQATTF
jgi:hypothetical protein